MDTGDGLTQAINDYAQRPTFTDVAAPTPLKVLTDEQVWLTCFAAFIPALAIAKSYDAAVAGGLADRGVEQFRMRFPKPYTQLQPQKE